MIEEDADQACPFCHAAWGECAHFLILSDWEKAAVAAEASPPVELKTDVGSTGSQPKLPPAADTSSRRAG
ncbi:hypothetical protein [Hoeflea marina]|uniref:hypothetical protein n=1 Tax=Hoeflea marina TaxID=274592 RepID=UPI000D713FEE|nr:hypothetical protein [Hoeflea marina]